jgi:hypothetical protein
MRRGNRLRCEAGWELPKRARWAPQDMNYTPLKPRIPLKIRLNSLVSLISGKFLFHTRISPTQKIIVDRVNYLKKTFYFVVLAQRGTHKSFDGSRLGGRDDRQEPGFGARVSGLLCRFAPRNDPFLGRFT